MFDALEVGEIATVKVGRCWLWGRVEAVDGSQAVALRDVRLLDALERPGRGGTSLSLDRLTVRLSDVSAVAPEIFKQWSK